MRQAVICEVVEMRPHPDADKLDLLWLSWPGTGDQGIRVITGKHYRVGQLGIYIPFGLTIPGWMAEDMWLYGRKTAMKQRFDVRRITLQGLPSPGLFCGEIYRKDADDGRSVDRYKKLADEGGDVVIDTEPLYSLGNPQGEWIRWPFWRPWWKLGDDVTAYLGLTYSDAVANLVK